MKTKKINALLVSFITICPFVKGLYFYHAAYVAGAVLLGILTIHIIQNRKLYVEKSANHFVILLGVFLYFITVFYAIDKGMAFMGFLKVLIIYLFYLVLMQSDDNKDVYLKAMVNSGIIMSVIGLLSFFIPFLGQEFIENGRLGSVLQYPNTYALFALVCILLTIAKNRITAFQLLGVIIMWAAIFLTFSRSMYVIGIGAVLVYLIYDRIKIKYVIPTCIIGMGLGYLIMNISDLSHVFNRIGETSTGASEWLTRLLYYKDSLSIMRDYPFGTGHLGYYYVQRVYQTGATYFVKYIHSNVLQIIMDIGFVGLLLMAAYFLLNIFSKRLRFHEKLALIVIFGHGAMDFDWEFPVVVFLILLIVYVDKTKVKALKIARIPSFAMIIMVTSMYIYMSISAYFAYIGDYEKALSLYPYNTEAKGNLAEEYREENKNGAYELAIEMINQNRFALKGYIFKRDIDYETRNLEEALISAEKIVQLNPLNMEHLEIYSAILLDSVKVSMKLGDRRKAHTELEKIFNIPYYIDRLAKERLTDYNVKHVPRLKMTTKLIQINKQAEKLLDETRLKY